MTTDAGRCASRRSAALRAEPVALSQAKPAAAIAGEFQAEVASWMAACFGPIISSDQLERADRFIEEALELAQTMPQFTADRAHALVDYVFGRPTGERYQEVGGVMVTLAALCNTVDLTIEEEAQRELARIWTKVETIRAKQAAKPTGSALPIALAAGTRRAETTGSIPKGCQSGDAKQRNAQDMGQSRGSNG